MSVIAWDGKLLAADKRATLGNLANTTTKIFRVRDVAAGQDLLVAVGGKLDIGLEVVEWIRLGRKPEEFPAAARGDDNTTVLVITPDGAAWVYERTPAPARFEGQYAMGSGRDFAVAAMHLGRNAQEAVLVASKFDVYCGNGVDVLSLEG